MGGKYIFTYILAQANLSKSTRTPLETGHIFSLLSTVFVYILKFSTKDTSLTTLSFVPMVSILEEFHCTHTILYLLIQWRICMVISNTVESGESVYI